MRRWIRGTFAGRALALGGSVKLGTLLLRALGWREGLVGILDTLADITLVVGGFMLLYRLVVDVKAVLLWRVRRKLTLSYIFIGFVPVLLIIILFLTSGLLLFFNVSQYVARSGVADLVTQADFLAESAAVGLQGSGSRAEVQARLARRQAGAVRAFPLVSYAAVPAPAECRAATDASRGSNDGERAVAGPWAHVPPPETVPAWTACDDYAGLIAFGGVSQAVHDRVLALLAERNDLRGRVDTAALQRIAVIDAELARIGTVRTNVAARAVAWPDDPTQNVVVVVDVPLSDALVERLERETGIHIGDITGVVGAEDCSAPLVAGEPPASAAAVRTGERGQRESGLLTNPLTRPLGWVYFQEYTDWTTGRRCNASMQIRMTMADLYNRISATTVRVPGAGGDVSQLILTVAGLVGALFLVIQVVALFMGVALARSITGAIHELFVGTERVRRGDFTHKIAVHSGDQLGELAESFNSMTSSIEDLLREKAEKERLEQELRIARSIQMSLLPQGGINMPGLSLTAHCEPAREVGGDYYDYLPIDEHRIGLLIADVAGKGTSAALYMAELKGLMLSLSGLHTSPRTLLIDANRIISRHLDSRSFITITYAVVDMERRILTYARAGHCPLIYVPGSYADSRAARILTPDGLVLGLQIDDGSRFDSLLVEESLPLGPGDLFLFYTDGLTEVMDNDGNCFGDQRLGALLQEHADLPFEELRERILRELAAFSGPAVQQDDMTMLLLKVDEAHG